MPPKNSDSDRLTQAILKKIAGDMDGAKQIIAELRWQRAERQLERQQRRAERELVQP